MFFYIRLAMVSKHSELVKRKGQDHYGRFASPSRCTAPPSSDDSSVKMWEVSPPPPTCLGDYSWTSSCYNDEYPHVKEVSSYELLQDCNCLV
jgi:hypothetical protein